MIRRSMIIGLIAAFMTPLIAFGPGIAGAEEFEVKIAEFAFSPAELTIKAGDVVRWVNEDGFDHNITADGESFKSEDFNKGGAFSHTFTEPGKYSYNCGLHPFMTGEITVE